MSKQDTTNVKITFDKPFVLNVPKLDDEKQMLDLAKEQIIELIKNKKVGFTYSFIEGNPYTFETAKIGNFALVEIAKNRTEVGVITQNTGKNIYVALRNSRVISGPPTSFQKVDEATINLDSFMWERDIDSKNSNYWSQGNTGYFVNGQDIIPFVMGKTTTKKYQIISLRDPHPSYSLEERNLTRLFDKKSDAEAYLSKITPKSKK